MCTNRFKCICNPQALKQHSSKLNVLNASNMNYYKNKGNYI